MFHFRSGSIKCYTYIEILKSDIDKPLITILTLNTIAHTVGAILVGVQAEKTFGNGNNSVAIVSSVMTFLILILSEIIPKTIGAKFWKELAGFTTTTLNIPIKNNRNLMVVRIDYKINRRFGSCIHFK